MLAQLRAADIVIAIERYRRAHDGALPASIDLLVPQFVARVPIDPFSGSAVLLGKTKRGTSLTASPPTFETIGGGGPGAQPGQ